jgi:conjugative relaxase-like TrwC/TraI family protein
LHSHCILFNATRDAVEDRWKALEACEMVTAQKFVRNVYYHELVRLLQKFGYGVENNPRGDFEIVGVSRELIDCFSNVVTSWLPHLQAALKYNEPLNIGHLLKEARGCFGNNPATRR